MWKETKLFKFFFTLSGLLTRLADKFVGLGRLGKESSLRKKTIIISDWLDFNLSRNVSPSVNSNINRVQLQHTATDLGRVMRHRNSHS